MKKAWQLFYGALKIFEWISTGMNHISFLEVSGTSSDLQGSVYCSVKFTQFTSDLMLRTHFAWAVIAN